MRRKDKGERFGLYRRGQDEAALGIFRKHYYKDIQRGGEWS
jgi:hypothetical protein